MSHAEPKPKAPGVPAFSRFLAPNGKSWPRVGLTVSQNFPCQQHGLPQAGDPPSSGLLLPHRKDGTSGSQACDLMPTLPEVAADSDTDTRRASVPRGLAGLGCDCVRFDECNQHSNMRHL